MKPFHRSRSVQVWSWIQKANKNSVQDYCVGGIFNTFFVLTIFHLVSALVGIESMSAYASDVPSLCSSNCSSQVNETETAKYCSKHPAFNMIGRCCVSASNATSNVTIVGIDLTYCDMSEEKFSNGTLGMNSLKYISLEGNSLHNVSEEDFHRNTDILYLSLPKNLRCPGREGTWKEENVSSDATICRQENNACLVQNLTCPDNSHCVHSGVDLVECLCNEGFHGYKCMNQGTFPVVPFVVGIIIPTIVISIFLCCTQRRYIVTQRKRK